MGSSPPGSPFHGIYRQEYWSGLLFPSLGDLPNPGIKPLSPAWLVDSLPLRHLGSPNELGFGSKELLCGFWKTIRFLSKWKEESEVAQSCSTFCNPMDCSPPGFSIHGIFQARILEWVAVSFSRRSSWPRDRTWVSHIAGRCFPIQNVMRTSWFHYYPFLHFFFTVFIEFVTILLLSYVLACWPQSTWDLSSPTRGWTWTPCIGRQSLNHWATREVPIPCIFMHQLIEMGRFWPHVLCL